MAFLRQPIISVLGHVDHGKTSLLDFIRKSKIINKEAGNITQHIGATEIPIKNINDYICKFIKPENIKIPGLLFIDTPGHKAFTSLRRRGGNISDIGILVVDINEGFKPQTKEALEILKNTKTPFIVAANKIDLLNNWISYKNLDLLSDINKQTDEVKYRLEEKTYELVNEIANFGLDSDRFDRIEDFTKKIPIIPISAKTGEGIAELLATLIGLTQKYFEKRLTIENTHYSKGVILETKEYQGLGITFDAIIYDGVIKKSDKIFVLTEDEVVDSKIRSILKPVELKEIRDKATKFKQITEAPASAGIKICAPDLEKIIPGMPFITTSSENEDLIEIYKQELLDERSEVEFTTDTDGVYIKADTLGSLEALLNILRENDIKVRKAKLGKITKKDIIEVSSENDNNFLNSLIIAFNVVLDNEVKLLAEKYNVTIINGDVIYKLIDDTLEWIKNKENEIKRKTLERLTLPFKAKILKGCIFRKSNPAIVGIECLGGTVRKNVSLITDELIKIPYGIKSIKVNNENASEIKKGEQGAVSIEKMVINKNADVGTLLYSFINETEFRELKKNKDLLTSDEKAVLKEIAELMRKENSFWGR